MYLLLKHESIKVAVRIALGSTFHAGDARTCCKLRLIDCLVLWSCVSQLKREEIVKICVRKLVHNAVHKDSILNVD